MAEAIVGPLVGKLQELALNETKALVAVNGDIRSLRERLMWMQAFLRHADPRRRDTSNELIRVWIKQTRDAAFDAEDAIDRYYLKVDLSRYPGWTQSIIMFLAGFTTQVSIRHELSRKIAEINIRLEDIINNKEKYKIDDAASNSAIVQWKPSTNISSAAINLDVHIPVVKRKKEEDLEKAFHVTQKGQVVIFVKGESGVGKTTLVRQVYEKSTTKAHFRQQVWASFPPHLSSSNIIQIIYQKLQQKKTLSKKKDEDVEMSLKRMIKGENFLLVIDGEVSNTDLRAILAALQDEKDSKLPEEKDSKALANLPDEKDSKAEVNLQEEKGSKVVVICIMDGSQSIGNITKHHIKLRRFDKPATTMDLFMKMMQKGEKDEDQILTTEIPLDNIKIDDILVENKLVIEETDKKLGLADVIHYITRGLPLAIVLLSGLVRTKEYPNEWKAVFKHLMSKQSKRLDSILTMCFDDLPHDLKSCFLYFAALPVNTLIETRKLVCMWMAEGFLTQKDGRTIERVGRIYLKELIARNLVKLVKNDDTNGNDEFVSVHHEVHEFLQVEAQEANFVDIHNGDSNHSFTTARRLSLQNYTDKLAPLKNSLPKLRSILSNFQKEEESDSEEEYDEDEYEYENKDDDEDEDEDEDDDEDEDKDKENENIEEDRLRRVEDQEYEVEEKEESDGNVKEEEQKDGEDEDGADETIDDEGEQDNEQDGSNEEDKRNEEGIQASSHEQEKDVVKPTIMPWSGLSRCWGQGVTTQDNNNNNEEGVQDANHEEEKDIVKPTIMGWSGVSRCLGKGVTTKDNNKSYIRRMLHYSQFLRVINLQGIDIGKDLPSTIKNAAHLQYLGVTACLLEHIPSTVGKLQNLQTLDVRNTSVTQLPIEFWKIKTLRHVFGDCLILPKRVGDLKDLQTLETIQPDENIGWDSKTFERMKNLRTLKIWDFSDDDSANANALPVVMEGSNVLQYIETMELYSYAYSIPLKVFTSNQRRLSSLTLDGKLEMLPKEFKFRVPNLTFLSLENTRVTQDFIDKLSKLPLTNLILDTKSYVDDQNQIVFRDGGFRSLTKLKLSDLADLTTVEITKFALQELKNLEIVWYPEELKIVVHSEHEFIKKIQDEDLFNHITIASKKTGQVLTSRSMKLVEDKS